MKTCPQQHRALQAGSANYWPAPSLPSLDNETRPTLPTDVAAHYLNRKPQTLRVWACRENGPIRAIRVHGRLAWNVEEIRALLSGGSK